MNPYKILGVTDQATDEEVKQAYRAKAAKYHPDAGGDAWVFAQVREAYDQILVARQQGSAFSQAMPRSATPPANQASAQSTKSSAQSARSYSTGPYTAHFDGGKEQPHAASQPLVQRLLFLLFHHQLPLQSETSYFILVNVLDIVFTNVLLRMHAMEANPIANQILIHWGFHGMIAFKLFLVACVCLITQLIAVQHLRRARQTLYLGTFIVGAVVAYSAYLLARGH